MKNKIIALVGQPNAGKSTLFNVLSDIKISTSNFAGTTVKVNQADINIDGETYTLIDLPGTYSLNYSDAAEEVTYNYLINDKIDLIINVVDATLLTRSLELTIELIELGLPVVIALNMIDEAKKHGVKTDDRKLEELLGVPVIPTTAIYGKGIKELTQKAVNLIDNKENQLLKLDYTHHLEVLINDLSDRIPISTNGFNGNKRFYAIKSIENPKAVPAAILDEISDDRDKIFKELYSAHKKDGFETISYERHHIAMKLSEAVSQFKSRKEIPLTDKLDAYLLHPFFGYIYLLMFFFLYFFTIFAVGSLLSMAVDIPIQYVDSIIEPIKTKNLFLWFTINGAWQGTAGALGLVLPYFLPLVFLTSIMEDTGYLARVAFLVDGFMHKIGLHGKSVVAFILGFGCSVPAIYATRILENKKERILTGILIPFIPCSARISVIFALAAAFVGPVLSVIVFAYVLLIIALSGKLITKTLGQPMGLILEIPNLKTPSINITFKKTWIKINEFLKNAMLFLVIGSIILAWIEYFNVSHYINLAMYPLIKTVLGLPEQLGSTLVFGFLRKELIIVMANQALGVTALSQIPLNITQIFVFVIFVTLYFPCLTTFITIWKEFGTKTAWASSALSIVVATVSAFIFKLIFSIF